MDEGEIKIERIEPFSLEFPVEARSLDDLGPNVSLITREQLAERFPTP